MGARSETIYTYTFVYVYEKPCGALGLSARYYAANMKRLQGGSVSSLFTRGCICAERRDRIFLGLWCNGWQALLMVVLPFLDRLLSKYILAHQTF